MLNTTVMEEEDIDVRKKKTVVDVMTDTKTVFTKETLANLEKKEKKFGTQICPGMTLTYWTQEYF